MSTFMLAFVGLLPALLMPAQTGSPGRQPRRTSVVAADTSLASQTASAQAPTTVAADEKFSELTHRVRVLELEMLQKSQPATDSGPMIAAGAAILVALLALLGQLWLAVREDRRAVAAAQRAVELAKKESTLRKTEKILEFRLKQTEQFYAPMFALLRQSEGLYKKMRLQLTQDDPSRYRLMPNTDPKDAKIEVLSTGTWQDFRLLDQFPSVRGNAKALALADRVLEIGQEITKIISKHAGLASDDLLDLLGRAIIYLTHTLKFAII